MGALKTLLRTRLMAVWSRRAVAPGLLVLAAACASFATAADSMLGLAAPDFALRSAGGPNVRLSEQRGDVVVLSFWSSRCNVCRAQLAELDRLYATYRPAGFVVFGVNVDDDVAAAREFASGQKLQFPMLLDPAKTVARAYRVDAMPMLVAIDRFGNNYEQTVFTDPDSHPGIYHLDY